MDFQKILKQVQLTASKNSPTILTTMAVGGLLTTTIMAVKATPKALKLIELEEDEKGEELTKPEAIKATYKCYIPTVIMGAATVTCIISANNINLRRNAVLASMYTLTTETLKEYQSKVKQTLGEKVDRKIKDDIAQDHLDKTPLSKSSVIVTNNGDTLCFDKSSGRYFKSDVNKLEKIQNELNREILSEMWISLNDVYYAIGLDGIGIGDEIGWNCNDLLQFEFTAKIADNDQPCIVLDFVTPPSSTYRD